VKAAGEHGEFGLNAESIAGWVDAQGHALGLLFAGAASLAAAVVVALVLHRLAMAVLRRAAKRTGAGDDDILLEQTAQPSRWIMVAIAGSLAQRVVPLDPWAAELWRQIAGFAMPALFGWLAIMFVRAFKLIIERRADISVENNLQARRRRTRVGILLRIVTVLILFLTICMMLLSIPGVRNVGVTLMASAGLAGLAVGAAAQPALNNLIAGVQMAFTEPIRIDDVVIIAGEWGRIEDIRLTYVVVRVWDDRRLIVPVSKFLDEPFQNWTRDSSQLLGSAFFYVDPTADVPRIRSALEAIVKAEPLWDRRFFNLQVTDIKSDVMELRVLVTAADAGRAFDLRCAVREKLIGHIAAEMPQALPRHRLAPGEGGEKQPPQRQAA
jgi:small-conductance mechanosensitive channel